jgi:hypothetical protein
MVFGGSPAAEETIMDDMQKVRVADIRMPFGSTVIFMVKWVIASTPALIILTVLAALFWTVAIGFLGSSSGPFHRASLPSQKVEENPAVAAGTDHHEEVAYLDKLSVSKIKVGADTLGATGVWGEVKNEGDRALKTVEMTVYCLGPDDKPVFEKTYHPVLVTEMNFGNSNLPLKARI